MMSACLRSNHGRFQTTYGRGSSRLCRLRRPEMRSAPTSAKREQGENQCPQGRYLKRSSTFCAPGHSGKLCHGSMEAPVPSTSGSNTGRRQVFFWRSGRLDLPNTTAWKESPGNGSRQMGRRAKHRWRPNAWERIQRIGEKNGRKRSLLTDGRGIPLAIAADGANRHDSKLLEPTLSGVVIKRPEGPQNLCLDAGYVGRACLEIAESANYEAHVRSRGEEKAEKTTGGRSPGDGLWSGPTHG